MNAFTKTFIRYFTNNIRRGFIRNFISDSSKNFISTFIEMVTFIRSLFESALKTNKSLEFAVITGCLISRLFERITSVNAEQMQKELAKLFMISISYMDTYENFYHVFLLGILMNLKGYCITSNREAGTGRYDIAAESLDGMKPPIILELKVAPNRSELQKKTEEALQQIVNKGYDAAFIAEGYKECIHIGVSFYQKMCRVEAELYSFQENVLPE